MPRQFLYFINPVSGTKDKATLIDIISRRTTEQHIQFEITDTDPTGLYPNLKEKITTDRITDIIICGGDGSISQLAGTLLGVDVNFGVIPMGSGNGLALAANIPTNVAKALDIIFNKNVLYIDSFYINGKFSCMLCGLGLDAQVAHDFAKQKKRGLTTYIKQTIRNFFSAKPYPFSLSLEDKMFSTEAFFISIANSNQFGNNFTIAPQASLHDGLIDIVVVNKMSKFRLLWSVLKQVRQGQLHKYEDKKYHKKDIHYFQVKDLTIQNPGLAPFHIDGDPATTNETFRIKIIENAFRMHMP